MQVRVSPIPGKKVDHMGVTVQLIGRIEVSAERGNHYDFLSLCKFEICLFLMPIQHESSSLLENCRKSKMQALNFPTSKCNTIPTAANRRVAGLSFFRSFLKDIQISPSRYFASQRYIAKCGQRFSFLGSQLRHDHHS